MAGPIRQPIDISSLQNYIDRNIPQIKTPVQVLQFGYGQSNPTYLLTDSSSPTAQQYVLRKKPPGELLSKTAHAVEREYRVLKALQETDVPVPRVYGLCLDRSVIGTEFYVMEFLDGRIFVDPSMPGVSAEERRELWHSAITTLAKLHRVKFTSPEINLSTYGRHTDFYARQVRTLSTVSSSQSATQDIETQVPVGPLPHFKSLLSFFSSYPVKDKGTIIHGDYKIDNLIFHKTEPRVIGILDWELSTIGHPVSDLCNLMMPYVSAREGVKGLPSDDEDKDGKKKDKSANERDVFLPGVTPGLPSREQVLRWYTNVAEWDPTEGGMVDFGDGFMFFRTAVIAQGIAARYALRTASSAKAFLYGSMFPKWSEASWGIIKRMGAKEVEEGEKAKLSKL